MAYIFEYSFLCKNLYQAKKIRGTLTTEVEPVLAPETMGTYYTQIGSEFCSISIKSHTKVSGSRDEKNGWWVSS